jgi:hypothetical protein
VVGYQSARCMKDRWSLASFTCYECSDNTIW